jgi:hypothetical protein
MLCPRISGAGLVATERQQAIERIRHYLSEYKKMRGLHPDLIHSLHDGLDEPRTAHLRVSDLELLVGKPAPVDDDLYVKPEPPDRLIVGDIWEFKVDVKIKGKRKLVARKLRWEVIKYHRGQCAWQLVALDTTDAVYLLEFAPQYKEMTYVASRRSASENNA